MTCRSFSLRVPLHTAATLAFLLCLISPGLQAADSAPPQITFRDIFLQPVGPRGLQFSPRLLALNGRQVSISGYRVGTEPAQTKTFILAPLPAQPSDGDESDTDDLPASVVQVLCANDCPTTGSPERLQLQGQLELGQREEADGRISLIRLHLGTAPAIHH